MNLEPGKYYKMKVIKTLSKVSIEYRSKPDVSGIVFFRIEKIEKDRNNVHYNVWSNERVTIERNYQTSLKKIGVWTGKRMIPVFHFAYSYKEIEEISKEEFKRRLKYSSYGL